MFDSRIHRARFVFFSGLSALFVVALSMPLQAQEGFGKDFESSFEQPPSEQAPPTPATDDEDASASEEFKAKGELAPESSGLMEEDSLSDAGASSSQAGAPSATSDTATSDTATSDTATSDTAPSDTAPSTAAAPLAEAATDATGEAPSAGASDASFEARRFRAHNTLLGATGGIRVVDAASAPLGTFRLAFVSDFFFTRNFLGTDSNARHIGGTISSSFRAHRHVELFLALQSWATYNALEDPSLFQVLGDLHLGAKAFHWVMPFLAVGGNIELSFLNPASDIGLALKGTGLMLRGNATADLRGLDKPLPLIGRFNLGYRIDNSSALIADVESARYQNLANPLPADQETRHLLSSIERFALGINRTDFFTIALGAEAPLTPLPNFHVSPILEWAWHVPVNRQGFQCVESSSPPASGALTDGCLSTSGASATSMTLTLGARLLPPVRGLAFLLAADIGLLGTRKVVHELAPNAAYRILLGASYVVDTRPAAAKVERLVERVEVPGQPAELPVQGRVRGLVLEVGTGKPVAAATVHFPGTGQSDLKSGADGSFTSYRFGPGQVQIEITHPAHEAGSCVATIPAEANSGEEELFVDLRCEIAPLPKVASAEGKVVSEKGKAIEGATIAITGASEHALASGADGKFALPALAPGSYRARVEADGYLIAIYAFEVKPREELKPEIVLIAKPRKATVRVTHRRITIRKKIQFGVNKADILPSSMPLMTEIADVLLRNPHVRKVQIQGHTDNRGPDSRNDELSQNRAESVRRWLIDHGVEAERLEAKGFGSSRPLVPNITRANQARNRRVEFHILAQDQ